MSPQINAQAVAVLYDSGGKQIVLNAVPVDDNNQTIVDDNAKTPVN